MININIANLVKQKEESPELSLGDIVKVSSQSGYYLAVRCADNYNEIDLLNLNDFHIGFREILGRENTLSYKIVGKLS